MCKNVALEAGPLAGLQKLVLFDFLIHFSLTVFRRFHQKWRETIIKNSEIF